MPAKKGISGLTHEETHLMINALTIARAQWIVDAAGVPMADGTIIDPKIRDNFAKSAADAEALIERLTDSEAY